MVSNTFSSYKNRGWECEHTQSFNSAEQESKNEELWNKKLVLLYFQSHAHSHKVFSSIFFGGKSRLTFP